MQLQENFINNITFNTVEQKWAFIYGYISTLSYITIHNNLSHHLSIHSQTEELAKSLRGGISRLLYGWSWSACDWGAVKDSSSPCSRNIAGHLEREEKQSIIRKGRRHATKFAATLNVCVIMALIAPPALLSINKAGRVTPITQNSSSLIVPLVTIFSLFFLLERRYSFSTSLMFFLNSVTCVREEKEFWCWVTLAIVRWMQFPWVELTWHAPEAASESNETPKHKW